MLCLPSSPNFRDIGGYLTGDGRRVRNGLLFRSGGFHRLSPSEIAEIRNYCFRLRCDLRSAVERNTTPSLWPDSEDPQAVLTLDMGADPKAGNKQFFKELISDFSAPGAFNAMCTLQRHMPALTRSGLASLFERLVDQARLPAVIHCHHGKDRTGFVAAIILLALGVSREDAIDDYLLSNTLCDRREAAEGMRQTIEEYTGKVPDDALVNQLVAAHPTYLSSALEQIEKDYGGMPRFLEKAAGLDPRRLTRFRNMMLEDANDT